MQLAIITLGHVHTEDLEPLTRLFSHIEQLVLDIPPRDDVARHRAEFNRAVDAATADWVLIVREREVVDEALAKEVFDAASAAKVRGFRIRSTPYYAGRPLRLVRDDGEIRLFHRRNYMRHANKGQWDEITIQGPVVRLQQELRSVTFASYDEHRAQLGKNAKARGLLRRTLLFVRYAIGAQTRDANTLRYLWIEAGYDEPPAT
jgi:transcriptional regulator of nitric oxide reductase